MSQLLYSCILATLELSADNILHSVILVITILLMVNLVHLMILHNQLLITMFTDVHDGLSLYLKNRASVHLKRWA